MRKIKSPTKSCRQKIYLKKGASKLRIEVDARRFQRETNVTQISSKKRLQSACSNRTTLRKKGRRKKLIV